MNKKENLIYRDLELDYESIMQSDGLKDYCKSLVAKEGKMTTGIKEKIKSGNESTIRNILTRRKISIERDAQTFSDPVRREEELSKVKSIDEVIGDLTNILGTSN